MEHDKTITDILKQQEEDFSRRIVEEKKKCLEADRELVLDWVRSLDKYLGSIVDYSAFKGETFEEIDINDYGRKRTCKWVRVELDPEFDVLTQLRNWRECVGFVHYNPLQIVGYRADNWPIFIGGYGIPVRKKKP